jgi:hypothetical protein
MGIMVAQSASLALRYGRDDISIAMFFHGKNVNSLVLLKPAICTILCAIVWKINTCDSGEQHDVCFQQTVFLKKLHLLSDLFQNWYRPGPTMRSK